MDKKAARRMARQYRDSLSADECKHYSENITGRLLATKEYQASRDVLVYVSTGSEADTAGIIRKAWQDSKNVYVPKVYGKEMQFIKITSFDELAVGYYGIMEPMKDEPVWEKGSEASLCVMPGIAFDRQFNRIGYGGGFYDRFLADNESCIKAAICYSGQLIASIDSEDTDIKPDIIVTDVEVLRHGQY